MYFSEQITYPYFTETINMFTTYFLFFFFIVVDIIGWGQWFCDDTETLHVLLKCLTTGDRDKRLSLVIKILVLTINYLKLLIIKFVIKLLWSILLQKEVNFSWILWRNYIALVHFFHIFSKSKSIEIKPIHCEPNFANYKSKLYLGSPPPSLGKFSTDIYVFREWGPEFRP